MDAPHVCPFMTLNDSCQGHELGAAVEPPIILAPGRCPHWAVAWMIKAIEIRISCGQKLESNMDAHLHIQLDRTELGFLVPKVSILNDLYSADKIYGFFTRIYVFYAQTGLSYYSAEWLKNVLEYILTLHTTNFY